VGIEFERSSTIRVRTYSLSIVAANKERERERERDRQPEQAATTGRVWGLKSGRHVREVVVVESEARTMAAVSRCEVAFLPFYVGQAWS
jgi:hypothetical protein